ncbi:MAG: type II secretion system protein GspG [Candidatus Babeliales bacterium]
MAYTFLVGLLMVAAFVGIRTVRHRANVSTTEQALQIVKMAIDGYHARNDEYPASLNDLKPRYLKEIPKDGWGNALKYKITEGGKHPYELDSYGSEGPGGDASERISVWSK